MSRRIDIGEELESVLAELVAKGSYPSREEALREGVRLLVERETRVVRFKAEIQKGLDDVEAGHYG